MTKNLALAVQKDVSDQMQMIREMAQALEALFAIAKKTGDTDLLRSAQTMARKLDQISEKAYEVGEAVLDNAA